MAVLRLEPERILMRQELDETLDKLSDRLREKIRATLYLVGVYELEPGESGSGSANPTDPHRRQKVQHLLPVLSLRLPERLPLAGRTSLLPEENTPRTLRGRQDSPADAHASDGFYMGCDGNGPAAIGKMCDAVAGRGGATLDGALALV